MTRCTLKVYADLNPRYPSKGERRWAVFLRAGEEIEMRGGTFTSRRSAEKAACRLQVETSFRELGIAVEGEEVRR